MPQRTVASRISRFCKTGESAKSAKAEADDPDDEKAGPDPYQMVRAGLNRGLSVEAIATKEVRVSGEIEEIRKYGKLPDERTVADRIAVLAEKFPGTKSLKLSRFEEEGYR